MDDELRKVLEELSVLDSELRIMERDREYLNEKLNQIPGLLQRARATGDEDLVTRLTAQVNKIGELLPDDSPLKERFRTRVVPVKETEVGNGPSPVPGLQGASELLGTLGVPVADVEEVGRGSTVVVGDGLTDDTAAIQAAIDARDKSTEPQEGDSGRER